MMQNCTKKCCFKESLDLNKFHGLTLKDIYDDADISDVADMKMHL